MSTIRIEDWDGLEQHNLARARILRALAVLLLAGGAFAFAYLLSHPSGGNALAKGGVARPPAVAVPSLGGGVPSQLAAVPAIQTRLAAPPKPHPSEASSEASHAASSPAPAPVASRPAIVTPQIAAPAPVVHVAPAPVPQPAPAPAPAPAPSRSSSGSSSSGGGGSFDSSG